MVELVGEMVSRKRMDREHMFFHYGRHEVFFNPECDFYLLDTTNLSWYNLHQILEMGADQLKKLDVQHQYI